MKDVRLRIGGKSFSIIAVYAMIISVCYILPTIKYSISYIPLACGLLITYIFAIRNWKIDAKLVFPIIVCALGLAVMSFLVMRRWDMKEAINELIRALRFAAPAMLYLMIYDQKGLNKKQIKILFVVLSILFLFICHHTIKALDENSLIARILASGTLDIKMTNYRFQNVGGFEFCYSIGFATVFLLALLLNNNNGRLMRLCLLAAYIFFIYFIIRTQYMTLLLLTVIFSFVLIYLKYSKSNEKLILTIAILALVLFIPRILSGLSSLGADNESMLAMKFAQIRDLLGGGSVSALGARPGFYKDAFMDFLGSPIWGNVTVINGVIIDGMDKNHSTFFGYLQGMGIIGGVLFYYPIHLIIKAIRGTLYDCSDFAVTAWNCLTIMFFILSILNPIQYCFEICFVLFLYIPCGILAFGKADYTNKEQVR